MNFATEIQLNLVDCCYCCVMASSSYAQAINEQRYSLIEQLVTKLLHVQVSNLSIVPQSE